jgi:PKD repeat protein
MKKILLLASLIFTINAFSQCSTSFTYSTTSSSIVATSTSTGTTSATNYNWNLTNVNGAYLSSSNHGSNSVAFNSLYNGTYVVSLLLDSTSGSCSAASQTITVSGGQNAPACNASFTYTVSTVSAGQVDFTNTSPVDPYNNTTYNWTFGNPGMTSNSENPSYAYYYNGTYTVTQNVYNAMSGCTVSSSQTVSITNANAAPACNSNFTYTLGANGQVNFISQYGGIQHGSTWDFGDGHYLVDSNTVSNTYLYNGTYSVTLQIRDSLSNCFSSTTQTIAITNTATQPCLPTVSFSMHQDSLNPQPGAWLVSTYYSSQVTSAVWNWGDGTSTTGFAPAHTYTAAGNYHICVSVYSACGDSSTTCQNDSLFRMAHNSTNGTNSIISLTVLNVNATGIKTTTNETAQVSIYPNPSTGLFNLNINNTNATKAQINISNILGKVVYSAQEQINNNTFSKEIDLQNLANGAYFVKAIVDNKIFSSKLIISK